MRSDGGISSVSGKPDSQGGTYLLGAAHTWEAQCVGGGVVGVG